VATPCKAYIERLVNMFTVTLVHKYCGYTKTLQGKSLARVFKDNGLDSQIWIVKGIDYND
jgi:hypothetical protein